MYMYQLHSTIPLHPSSRVPSVSTKPPSQQQNSSSMSVVEEKTTSVALTSLPLQAPTTDPKPMQGVTGPNASASTITSLTKLDILFSNIQEKELGERLKNNPNLEICKIRRCKNLVNSWPTLIASMCKNLRTCSLVCYQDQCVSFTKETVAAILKNNPNMQHFGIEFCSNLSDEPFWAILQNGSNLESLRAPGGHQITGVKPQSMKEQAVNCAKLLRLDLSCCYDLTDKGLKEILSSCPNIQRITVSSCSNLTAAGLKENLTLCKNVKELDLSYCWKLSEEALKTILAVCPNLQKLNLFQCSLSKGCENWIFAMCPKLKSLKIPGHTYEWNGKNYNHWGF